MNYLLIILCAISLALQASIRKSYSDKVSERGTMLFNGCSCFVAAMFFWVCGGFKFEYNASLVCWALAFGLFFGLTTFASFKALQIGPLSLTSLVTSYSLLIATLYGIIFKDEAVNILIIIGLVLLATSLLLIAMKEKDENETKKVSLKWSLYAFGALISNGICTIIQREGQLEFDGKYKNEFMIVALVGIFVAFIFLSFFKERSDMKACLKDGIVLMVFWGILNGAANLFIMMLARMPASLVYPLISGGSIILTWIASRIFYKEKLTVYQNVGLVFGVGAVVFLNL